MKCVEGTECRTSDKKVRPMEGKNSSNNEYQRLDE